MKTKTCKTKWDLRSRQRKHLTYVVMLHITPDWHDDVEVARCRMEYDAHAIMDNYEDGSTYIISLSYTGNHYTLIDMPEGGRL